MERATPANVLTEAFKNGDPEQIAAAMNTRFAEIAQDLLDAQNAETDRQILATRGVRQLTSEETTYYQSLINAMLDKNPKQAVANLDKTLPVSVIERVFEDIKTASPLINAIGLIPSGGAVKIVVNKTGYGAATWGKLCDNITKELDAAVDTIESNLYKLSAFVIVCNEALELGPQWLDRYVRECLTEYFIAGLENAIVTGTGKDMPIGMDRDVSDDVTVVGGVYPQKTAIEVTDLGASTLGNLVGLLSVSDYGKPRKVKRLILVCNEADYYTKVFPATHIMAPDGTYRQSTPFPMDIVPTPELTSGEAVFGDAARYTLVGGTGKDGRIEYSDEYKFVEDKRAYRIKGYFYGRANDDKSFLRLDISGLKPLTYTVTTVDADPSTDATLALLTLGNLTLSPTFDPDEDTYTASTTNTSDIITVLPTNAASKVEIKLGTAKKTNGSALTWATGSNTVTVKVTAEDGTTTETYTVTVTKS